VAGQHEYGVSNWIRLLPTGPGISVLGAGTAPNVALGPRLGVCVGPKNEVSQPAPVRMGSDLEKAGEKGGGGGAISIPHGAGAWEAGS